ncbi:DUF5776 domain-containing protein [Levilactobacillus fuyuanensis]|uniref:DUF5776 domain-containing protein n=1 Tax=Levilactobacillus fuyuanensis TaxID=2486022 RepID=A0ABW4H1F7_9LACO|nr:DUF5776 domain-containing protein [Levilactobacillus fuyuanensis]
MMTLIQRLTLISLSLILIGGGLMPTIVQAATRQPTETAPTRSNSQQTYTFDSAELPYNFITDAQGKTSKMFWFPNATAHEFTTAEITGSDFAQKLTGNHQVDINASNVANAMNNLAVSGLTIDPNEPLAQYLFDKNIVPTATNLEDFSKAYKASAYMYAWIYQAAADKVINKVDFNTAKAHYETTLKKKLVSLSNLIGPEMLNALNTIFSDETQYDDNFAGLLFLATANYLTTPPEELVNLDPSASEAKAGQLIKEPIKAFIHTSNGKVMADGVLTSYAVLIPITYAFKNPSAPGPGPTPPPNPNSQPVTIHYLDEREKVLKPAKTLIGALGDHYQTAPLTIPGYHLVKTIGQETGIFTTSQQSVTYTYAKNTVAPVIKNSVIYATKGLNLYAKPTLTRSAKQAHYAKKSRMNRPMFKVIGFATSKNGVKRYRVKDLNGRRVTGYITTRTDYVAPVYYAGKPKQLMVINPQGLNGYAKKNLTGKRVHYRQGQVLRVKQIVSHNLTTRFILSNGQYVSGNKKLVIAGKHALPKRIRTKTAINRYGTANLSKKNKHIAKGTILKVTGWAYSNANNFRKGDTLRYKVAGGYITANSRFIQAIK